MTDIHHTERRAPQDGDFEIKTGHHTIGNQWIVPYCPLLSKTFNTHIYVEYCNSIKSIKYICKYVNKGYDAAMFTLQQQTFQDEVTHFQMGWYICSNRAFWRIFGLSIHEQYPPVKQLLVHLESGQRIYFTTETAAQQSLTPRETTLTTFFKLCQKNSFAKNLFYYQLPSYYTWNNQQWNRRKRGTEIDDYPDIQFDNVLGRVYTVHLTQQEYFYL
ncbi:uncharacterized protein LOC115228861 [Octopus sinensis]|uniref:Uncharacterized protein LOC115228861 n=1 Tax=Octopus sinensis TaxID=2607531 RepID=A0A6P7TTW6_9MOLL|nr:uncharacterized protein LOC115228861 [Octopus sinensis]